MNEKTLLSNIQVTASRIGARLFRNNVGTGWVGKITRATKVMTTKIGPGDIVIRQARPLHAGLCKGSSDLIGWTPITIQEDMVGKTVAVFTAIECKTGHVKTTKEQADFIKYVRARGGKAGIVYKVSEALEVMSEF